MDVLEAEFSSCVKLSVLFVSDNPLPDLVTTPPATVSASPSVMNIPLPKFGVV